MADLAGIAQSGVDPVSGSYLSPERRKAVFARSRISSSVFSGGGALVPIERKAADISQSLTVIQENKVTLESISAQLNGFREQITDISGALNKIAYYIANESSVESVRAQQENDYQRKLAEQQVRIGAESQLEQKIQSALAAPVNYLAGKVTSIFDNVKRALFYIFLGWLTNQGIEALKANSDGNKNKLEQIKDATLNALTVVGKTLLTIKKGFDFLVGGLAKLTLKIGKFVVNGLIIKPFQAVMKGLGNAAKSIFRPAAAVAKPAAEAGVKAAGKLGIKGTFGKIPLLSLGTAALFGGMRLAQGDVTGAGMEAASGLAATIPGWGTAGSLAIDAAIVGRDYGAFKGTPLEKNENTAGQSPKPAKSKAQQPIVNNFQFNSSDSNKSTNNMSANEGKENIPSDGRTPSAAVNSTQQSTASVSAAQTQKLPTQLPQVGPEPSPTPNVIVASTPTGNSGPSAIAPPPSGESITDVPLIPSANIDNFYILYSQLNYNVVT